MHLKLFICKFSFNCKEKKTKIGACRVEVAVRWDAWQ